MTAGATFQERLARRLDYVRARQDLQRDLERLLGAGPRVAAADSGARIGLAALSSGPWHLALQILLAHALRARGAATRLLLCDLPDLPICNERLSTSRSIDRCDGCLDDKRALLAASGLEWDGLGACAPAGAVAQARAAVAALADAELRTYRLDGWPIGTWLDVSAAHYLRRDGSGDDAEQVATRRRLLTSAIVTLRGVQRWLDDQAPTIVIVQGGVHFMWRIVFELARGRGIPVVSREMGKGGWDHHLYALNRDSMAPDLDASWRELRGEPLLPHEDAAVDAFLDQLPARTFRPGADAPLRTPEPAAGRPAMVAFTNVTWDMATAERDAGFSGLADWLRETVRICRELGTTQLIVRAHPAEAGDAREHVIGDVLGAMSTARESITLVPPSDPTPASLWCERAGLVTVYNSTAGLEAAARGRPVLVGGRPHFRGRGFTIDVDSREHYRAVLAAWTGGAPLPIPPDAAALARRYAHMFYLRYHIPMGWTTSPLEPPFALTIRSLRELAPGHNRALDMVCDAIFSRRQVLLPRELAGAHRCDG